MSDLSKTRPFSFPVGYGWLRFVAVVTMLPSVVMMISFVKEGLPPPVAPMLMVAAALLAAGFGSQLIIGEQENVFKRMFTLFGVALYTRVIPRQDVQYLDLYSNEHEDETWEKDHSTGQYERHKTGRFYTSWGLRLVTKKRVYGLSWKDNTRDDLTQLGQRLRETTGVAFYPAGTRPPVSPKRTSHLIKYLFFAGVVGVVLYAVLLEYQQRRALEDLAQAQAIDVGLSALPDLEDTPLDKGMEIMVFSPSQQHWVPGEVMEQVGTTEKVRVHYLHEMGWDREGEFGRSMIRSVHDTQ